MTVDFPERLSQRAETAGIHLTSLELGRFHQYWRLLKRWNTTINLTALPLGGLPARTIDRLFIEPLVAAELVADGPLRWYDLGSGGGSPAIPLKVRRPATLLTMVESRQRKAAFLREVVRTLDLKSAEVEAGRFEEIASGDGRHGMADLVTVRAVRRDRHFADTCAALLKQDGRLLFFGVSSALVDLSGFRLDQTARVPEGGSAIYVYVPRGTG